MSFPGAAKMLHAPDYSDSSDSNIEPEVSTYNMQAIYLSAYISEKLLTYTPCTNATFSLFCLGIHR